MREWVRDYWASLLVVCVAAASITAVVLQAQNSNTSTAPLTINQTFQIKPQLLTVGTAVDLCSLPGGPPCHKDVYVCYSAFFTGSNATTITTADEQGSPVTHDNAIAIAANSRYIVQAGIAGDSSCIGEWYPGGMTITAGNANYLTVYVRGKWWGGAPLF